MSHEYHQHDPLIAAALDELRSAITSRYPEAIFDVFDRDDPQGIRLRATVDIEDTDEILDTVIGLLFEIQVEQGLPIYVVHRHDVRRETAIRHHVFL